MHMDVVLFCCNTDPVLASVQEELPFPLMPLGTRPVLEHCLDLLVADGFTRIFCMVDSRPELVRSGLDVGKWGVDLRIHSISDFDGVGRGLQSIWSELNDTFLLLPCPVLTAGSLALPENHHRITAYRAGGADECLAPVHLSREELLPTTLNGCRSTEQIISALPFDTESRVLTYTEKLTAIVNLKDLWQANMDFLHEKLPFLRPPGRTTGTGIVAERGVSVDKMAVLTGPVHLGADASIESGVRLGPGAAVGPESILDNDVHAENCVVARGSYIGPNMDISGCMVIRSYLIRPDQGTAVRIPDPFLLGATSDLRSDLGRQLMHRTLGGLLLVLTAPVSLGLLAANALFPRNNLLRNQDILGRSVQWNLDGTRTLPAPMKLPTFATRRTWINRLPWLLQVLTGKLDLVGIEPLTEEQAKDLEEWEWGRFQAAPGIVQPWHGLDEPAWEWSEKRVMEAYYAQTRSVREDLKILGKAALRLFKNAYLLLNNNKTHLKS